MTTRTVLASAIPLAALTACDGVSSVFSSSGQPGGEQASLGRLFTVVGVTVLVIVTGLLLVALFRRRTPTASDEITRRGSGTSWILVGGVIVPVVILVTLFIFVLRSLSATANPPTTNLAGTFDIVGHRWWWEVRRADGPRGQAFVTANELHIPVGRPVRLRLSSVDVIHSFWVPQLAGKIDLIPGKVNQMWIEADTAGVYVARCAEYCGLQHAHMAMRVIAESDASYARWLSQQALAAREPVTGDERHGRDVFLRSPCASCHQIRGTSAGAIAGPDLTHLASRRTIGAGTLPNTEGNLAGWIANSQAIKPGNDMPPMYLTSADLHAIIEYLRSLE